MEHEDTCSAQLFTILHHATRVRKNKVLINLVLAATYLSSLLKVTFTPISVSRSDSAFSTGA